MAGTAYEAFLELGNFEGKERQQMLPQWIEAATRIGLDEKDMEFAVNEFIPEMWDLQYLGHPQDDRGHDPGSHRPHPAQRAPAAGRQAGLRHHPRHPHPVSGGQEGRRRQGVRQLPRHVPHELPAAALPQGRAALRAGRAVRPHLRVPPLRAQQAAHRAAAAGRGPGARHPVVVRPRLRRGHQGRRVHQLHLRRQVVRGHHPPARTTPAWARSTTRYRSGWPTWPRPSRTPTRKCSGSPGYRCGTSTSPARSTTSSGIWARPTCSPA